MAEGGSRDYKHAKDEHDRAQHLWVVGPERIRRVCCHGRHRIDRVADRVSSIRNA